MFFLAPFHLAQLMTSTPVDGNWILGLIVAGFGFIFWQYLKSIRDDIREIDSDVKEIKEHMTEQDAHLHKQDLVIMRITTRLGIHEP